MAYPILSKTGVPTVTFPRGPGFPSDLLFTPRQIVTTSEAGQVRVATLSVAEQTLTVIFKGLPESTITALLTFLQHALVNWAAHTVTYTDVDGVAWTVRVINTSFARSQVTAGLYDATLQLRKELA